MFFFTFFLSIQGAQRLKDIGKKNLFILVSSRGSTSNASAEALGIFGDGCLDDMQLKSQRMRLWIADNTLHHLMEMISLEEDTVLYSAVVHNSLHHILSYYVYVEYICLYVLAIVFKGIQTPTKRVTNAVKLHFP